MADSDKIDEMHGMLHAMKPMLEDVRSDQKAMDVRVRAAEIQGGIHSVEIKRINEDIDGLGRKVRSVEVRVGAPVVPRPPRADDAPGKWAAVAEFLGALPVYWHFAAVGVAWAVSIVAILRRHHGQ